MPDVLFATLSGVTPLGVQEFGPRGLTTYVIDLGLGVPSCAIAAYLLWRGRTWSFVIIGALLIWGALMAPTLIAITVVDIQQEVALTPGQIIGTILPPVLVGLFALRYLLVLGRRGSNDVRTNGVSMYDRSRASIPRSYALASVAILVLTVIAALVDLFVPGFYRDAPALVPQLHGQDLVTLVLAVPALAASVYYGVCGSLRGYVVWLDVVGYLIYTYASYAFMTTFNKLYLVYVALLGLALYTFVSGMVHFDATALWRTVGERSVRPYVAFQLLVALMITFLWLARSFSRPSPAPHYPVSPRRTYP